MCTRLKSQRSKQGILGSLILCCLLLMVFLFGTLSSDIAHNVSVRGDLQNAADAAALAGAYDFIQSGNYYQAEPDAVSVASQNYADGRAVASSSPGTTVTVETQQPVGIQPGVCQVSAQMTIDNIFARMINHPTDSISVTSTANGYQSVTGVNQDTLFPLAVSIDTTTNNSTPLYQANVGDTVEIYINSQQYKNAAYTGYTTGNNNAKYINEAIDQALGVSPIQPGFIPALKIGDTIGLINGIAGTKSLASGAEYSALLNKDVIYMPLIAGAAPFNKSRPVVGFIGLHVTGVVASQSGGREEMMTAIVTKGVVQGTPGPVGSPTGNPNIDAAIQGFSPGMVALGDTINFDTTSDSAPSGSSGGTPANIACNFNGTAINGILWFNSVCKLSGVNQNANSTVWFTNQTVTYSVNNVETTVKLPDSKVLCSPSATTASTTFDTANNIWVTMVPLSCSGNVFLAGSPYMVPGGSLPGGIKGVVWDGKMSTDTPGLSLQWQWAASVYSQLTTDNTAIGVKPVDDNQCSQYQNSDHAGSPQNYLQFLANGGGTGGGGSNYTGSYSSTASCTPQVIGGGGCSQSSSCSSL